MSQDIYIDGKELTSIGVYMGDGFLDALLTPPTLKEFAQNDARTKDGVQLLFTPPKVAAREVTLPFIVCGDTPLERAQNMSNFLKLLRNIPIGLYAPKVSSDECYWLAYTGKSVTFSIDLSRTASKFSGRFNEYNPTYRTLPTWAEEIKAR